MACVSSTVAIVVSAGVCGPNVPPNDTPIPDAPLASPYQGIITLTATASDQATGIQAQATAASGFVATIQTAFFVTRLGSLATKCPTTYPVGPVTLCESVQPYSSSSNTITSGASTTSSQKSASSTGNKDTNHGSKAISNGSIAGIGIGCAIIGALIALAAFLLLSRRRNRRSPRADKEDYSYGADAGPGVVGPKKSAVTSLSFEKGSAAEIVENNLDQPLGDSVLQDDYGKIGDKIDGHVQSFYNTDAAVDHRAVAQTIAQALGEGSPYTMPQIAEWLENPYARAAVLRFAVASIILSRVRLECDSGLSFLPPPLASCLQSMSQTKMEDKGM
jgi:hypothetical protein